MFQSAHRRLALLMCAWAAIAVSLSQAVATPIPRLKPPAPEPVYVSRADHSRLTTLSETLKAKRFSEAKSAIQSINDPIAKSLGQWMYFSAEDPLVSLREADAFLDTHPDWPAFSRIQRFVEGRIPRTEPAANVIEFFDGRDPVTGDGHIQLARALFQLGHEDAGEIHLKKAWIDHNFTASKERTILANYGGRLSKDDHAARVDRLLWARQVTNARRVFSKLSGHERKKAEARAALLLGASTAPRLYSNLSAADQKDSGVLMAAVRYYRRKGDQQYAISLAGEAPLDPELLRNPGRWWYERQLLMRWALKEGRFGDAYKAAAHHSVPGGSDFAEAEFNAGWIALRFLNEPKRAETHFTALASGVGTPISLSRAYYWLGRTAKAKGDATLAQEHFREASQHYYSFYGQLAAEELGGAALQAKFGPPAISTAEDRALFSSRPAVAALRILSDLGLDYEFMVFAYHVDDLLERPGEYVELAKLTNGEGAPHLTVRAGKVAIRKNAFAANVAYPTVFVPDEATRFVPAEIILGLSRQESEFNPRAFSRAGARGMMQLIPSTALITARKEGLRYSRSGLLDDPVYNMTIGSAHLSHLIDQFGGSLALTFAAYNAGPHRATRWIGEYGDPRSPDVDPIDWIELVPFSETRNYIQRVLENIQVYRGQLNNAPIPGRLSADIERGGISGRVAKVPFPSATLAGMAAPLGKQVLAPLPEATAERVRDFRFAQNAPTNTPVTQTPLQAAPNKNEKKKFAPFTPINSPSGLNNSATTIQATETNKKKAATLSKKQRVTKVLMDEPSPTADPPSAPTISRPQTAAHPTETPKENVPTNEATANNIAQTADLTAPSPILGSADESGEIVTEWMMEECLSYDDYLAQEDEDGESSATDLNAAMLSELQVEGAGC